MINSIKLRTRLILRAPEFAILGNGLLIGKLLLFPKHILHDNQAGTFEFLLLKAGDHLDNQARLCRIRLQSTIDTVDLCIGIIEKTSTAVDLEKIANIFSKTTLSEGHECTVFCLTATISNTIELKLISTAVSRLLISSNGDADVYEFKGIVARGHSGSPIIDNNSGKIVGFVLGRSKRQLGIFYAYIVTTSIVPNC